ncbi:hypothetical protein JOD45_001143 [Scopulibacillus daqui]|uniref:Uncharacterized protein n=1 Tax=Scopulibacillus daqui TaxID=1469162 RepID=A0ABS2PY18_9BACL|nr:hypothetical protein [Scopulibacillus daqui]
MRNIAGLSCCPLSSKPSLIIHEKSEGENGQSFLTKNFFCGIMGALSVQLFFYNGCKRGTHSRYV